MSKKAKNSLQKHIAKQAGKRNNIRSNADKARRKRALESMVRELGYDTRYVHITDTQLSPRTTHPTGPMTERAVGIFSSSERGFGFVRVEGRTRDVFIPAGHTAGAISGDTVEVRFRTFTAMDEEKTEGRVERITQPLRTVIGTIAVYDDPTFACRRTVRRYTLIPDDRRIRITPHVDDLGGARIGDKVELTLHRTSGDLRGRVTRVYGPADERAGNYEAILDDCGIEVDFPPDVLQQADAAAARPIDWDKRVDYRTHTVFTIDGADAKDLDDALSVRRLPGGGFQLCVHIADVSYYVDEKTPLDRAAMRRGTSVYFTDRVVPMLPPVLSNGVCSLNEGEDRAVLTVRMTVAPDGEITRTEIFPAVIRSRLRGVYSEINDVLQQQSLSPFYQKYRPILRALSALCDLYQARKARSRARGAMELDSAEAVILVDKRGEPYDIRRRTRGLSEQIIEHCMLAAGEAVATYMTAHHAPCVYRTHERPPEAQMRELLPYLHGLGLDIRGIDAASVTQTQISRLLTQAEEKGLSVPVSYRVLRAMSKATYQPVLAPHFGLAAPVYCHFTAPIRRVADLAVHRLLRRVLMEDAPSARYASFAARASRAAAEAELRAQEAERRIDALYKALYMQRFIGEVFDATVTSVASFGLFCTLDNTCEGLIPIDSLGGVFLFDEPTLTLRSRDTRYRIGDRLRVRLEEVDVSGGRLRFCDADNAYVLPKATGGDPT